MSFWDERLVYNVPQYPASLVRFWTLAMEPFTVRFMQRTVGGGDPTQSGSLAT